MQCTLKIENFEAEIQIDSSTAFNVVVSEWFRRGGDSVFLENHDIDQNSVVVDVGAYTGVWSEKINSKYHPQLIILEPVASFRNSLLEKFKDSNNVKILPYGLGTPGMFKMNLSKDGSSLFDRRSEDQEDVLIISFDEFISRNKIEKIDVLQVNIEGSEYDLFDQILNSEILRSIKKIQVQFHLNVQEAASRRQKIRERLSKTHVESLNFPFVWEIWSLKNEQS